MTAPHARALGAALGLAALASPAIAAPLSPTNPIPVGTTITGKMMTEIDTGKVEAGKGFSMAVTRPYPNGDPAYAGAIVRGHVSDVQHAAQGRKAAITLTFDSIVLPDGSSSRLTGHVLSVDKKQQTAVLQQAAGAGAGMIVGNIIGKALGTNAGGLVGAAGGFAYGNNRKTNYVIPTDAEVTLQTDAEVVRPQARQ
ncbi:MAG: hypothetical protein NVSMB21_02770 [Vulcanimicrobiaceae bacterium]